MSSKEEDLEGIGIIVTRALEKFGKVDLQKTYLEYLQSEWYYSIEDLQLAIEDGQAWSDLKLPGRLKLELKQIILDRLDGQRSSKQTWLKCFSVEDGCPYYYNMGTGITQWDLPLDGTIIDELESVPNKRNVLDTAEVKATSDVVRDEYLERSDLAQRLHALTIGIISPAVPEPNNDRESLLGNQLQTILITNNSNRVVNTVTEPVSSNVPGHIGGDVSSNIPPLPDYATLSPAPDRGAAVDDLDISFDSETPRDSIGVDLPPSVPAVSYELVARLLEMGFVEQDCIHALEITNNDVDSAAQYLVTHSLPGN